MASVEASKIISAFKQKTNKSSSSKNALKPVTNILQTSSNQDELTSSTDTERPQKNTKIESSN
jgi:hypothetical protein